MPAQRKSVRREQRLRKKHKSVKPKKGNKFKYLIFFLIPLALFLWVSGTTKYWDSNRKLTLAIAKSNGDVSVVVFDPIADSMTNIEIPGETEVEVARHKGVWRLKSVAKLGEKEGIGAQLTAETLTKHFGFPVFLWAEEGAKGFVDDNVPGLLSAVISSYETSLGLGDKIQIGYFSLKVKNYKKEAINLAETRYLVKAILSDSEEGYRVTKTFPPAISALFADPEISDQTARTKIVDKTTNESGKAVGEIVQVLGYKVVAVDLEKSESTNCTVAGKSSRNVDFLANLFSCDKVIDSNLGFDIIITLGDSFDRRF